LTRLGPHEGAYFVAVSPDGRWTATGTHDTVPVKVWETQSGRLVKELPLGGSSSHLAFSPDGRWLATDCGGRRLWAVGSWEQHVLPDGEPLFRAIFSPDGRILAGETYHGIVCLTDPETGKEYARLEDPNQDRANWITFAPDGSLLLTVCHDGQALHVWDLRSLRDQLAGRGLDWDLPPYPPAGEADPPPLQLLLRPGDKE
jgi:WD40 repeat protein